MKDLNRFKKATANGETTFIGFNNIGTVSKYVGIRGAIYWFSFCYVGSANVDVYDQVFNRIAINADLLK